MKSFDYTIASTDSDHNNRIITNLANSQTEYCKMTITSLTTMANIIILGKDDYIVLNDERFDIVDEYIQLDPWALTECLNRTVQKQSLNDNGEEEDEEDDEEEDEDNVYAFTCDSCNRVCIACAHEFELKDCSYNMRLLLGLINVELPLSSHVEGSASIIVCPDVGMYMSTPVLYLASNLGSNSYKNANSGTTSMRILMRINNSFFAKQPITACNGDYTTVVRSSDLSDVRFTLIDANYHEVKLLSPMYLTVQIESIPDKNDRETSFKQGPVDPFTIMPMTQFAYMHDLTERGVDVDLNTVDKMIYIDVPQLDNNAKQQLMTVVHDSVNTPEQPSKQP